MSNEQYFLICLHYSQYNFIAQAHLSWSPAVKLSLWFCGQWIDCISKLSHMNLPLKPGGLTNLLQCFMDKPWKVQGWKLNIPSRLSMTPLDCPHDEMFLLMPCLIFFHFYLNPLLNLLKSPSLVPSPNLTRVHSVPCSRSLVKIANHAAGLTPEFDHVTGVLDLCLIHLYKPHDIST